MSQPYRSIQRHRRHRAHPQINLTPLIDILFNLIFFFILATNIETSEASIEVTLPSARSGAPANESEPIPVVSIDSAGGVFLAGRAVSDAELRAEMQSLAGQGKRRARLRTDGAAPSRDLFRVIDICRLAGVGELDFPVDPAGGN